MYKRQAQAADLPIPAASQSDAQDFVTQTDEQIFAKAKEWQDAALEASFQQVLAANDAHLALERGSLEEAHCLMGKAAVHAAFADANCKNAERLLAIMPHPCVSSSPDDERARAVCSTSQGGAVHVDWEIGGTAKEGASPDCRVGG